MTKYLLSMLTMTSLRFRQRGLTTVEYAVAGGLIAAAVAAAFLALGGTVEGEITEIDTAITQ